MAQFHSKQLPSRTEQISHQHGTYWQAFFGPQQHRLTGLLSALLKVAVIVIALTSTAQAVPEFDVPNCIRGVSLYSGSSDGMWIPNHTSWIKDGNVYAENHIQFTSNATIFEDLIIGGGSTSSSLFDQGTIKGHITVGSSSHSVTFRNNPNICSGIPATDTCIVTAGTYTGTPATNGHPVETNSSRPYTACNVPQYTGDSDPSETSFSSWTPPNSETLFENQNATNVDLLPGKYGRIHFKNSNDLTVNLHSGVYYINDLFFTGNSNIHFKINTNSNDDPVYFMTKKGLDYTSYYTWNIPGMPSFPVPSSSRIMWNPNGDPTKLIYYAETGNFILPSLPADKSISVLNAIVITANGHIRLIDGNENAINGAFLAAKQLVFYQYSFEKQFDLTTTASCKAPANEIGGFAFMQDNDVTPNNFTIAPFGQKLRLVQSTYDNTKHNWGGALHAFDVIRDPTTGIASPSSSSTLDWGNGAESQLKAKGSHGTSGVNARRIKTSSNSENEIAFLPLNLFSEQQNAITNQRSLYPSFFGTNNQFIEQIVNYHYGLPRAESVTYFQKRQNIMGDTVYCEPKLLGPSKTRYFNYNNGSETSHATFRSSTQNRSTYVTTCGNDGVIRFTDLSSGEETMAYLPRKVIGKLPITSYEKEAHEYVLDGAITLGDAYLNNAWTTVGIVTCGLGGSCLTALDLGYNTNLISDHRDRVLWELNANDITGTSLNLTIAEASIARIKDPSSNTSPPTYRWVAILGNGLPAEDANQKASLLIIDLMDKTKQWVIDTVPPRDQPNDGRGNGLGTPNILDTDTDGTADIAIACDRFGQCWSFNLKTITAQPTHLFSTIGHQPVWNRPAVSRIDQNTVQMYFGTGQYFTQSDHFELNTITQYFYGVKVHLPSSSLVSVNSLDTITVDQTGTINVDGESVNYRLLKRTNTPSQSQGWYLALPKPGERILSEAKLHGNQVFFNTTIPFNDNHACTGPATGWLMFLDKDTGLHSGQPTLDLNNDDHFNYGDKVPSGAGSAPPSGISYTGSTLSVPFIVPRLNSWKKTDAFVSRSGGTSSSVQRFGYQITAPSVRQSFSVVQ